MDGIEEEIVTVVVVIKGTILAHAQDHAHQALKVEAIGKDTMTEIEMTTDAEILVDLLRKETTTLLEDIDMTYHQESMLLVDSLIPIAYPIKGCFQLFFIRLP